MTTAIVTGASRGIGRAIAVALGQAGYRVAVNFNNNRAAAEECQAAVEAAGGSALILQANIANREDQQRLLAATVEAFGPVSLLVNNAGVAPTVRADLLEADEQSYDFVMDTNLKGPFFLTQLVARHMIEHRTAYGDLLPSIINIGSISAYTSSTQRGEYCLSKAGMGMMTKLFADRLANDGIHVYELRPGIIATDMTGPVKAKYDQLILQDGLLPIRRWGQGEDVAAAVLALAAGSFPYSTGQVIDVDGGFHLRRL